MSRRLQIGEMIGDYRIVGFLGAGGMGSVYHGIHTRIDRPVAIKLLSNPAQGSTFKERFVNEARVQSRMHHPNIATLYDFQESPDRDEFYIVMEYVDGETLDALIDRRHFAVEDALLTFQTICEAIKFIHENNIVHRDIKPQNIKISSRGVMKMLDFGIAKDSISCGLTRVGGIVGTPNYLAPEQLMGQPASRLTDIWALGVLFYEMLTGVSPFKGSTLAELHGQISNAQFERPEKLNAAVSGEVAKIVDKCVCVDVRQRYQSVEAVMGDVASALRRRQHPAAAVAVASRSTGIRNLLTGVGSLPSQRDSNPRPHAFGIGRLALAGAGTVVVLALVAFGLWAMGGQGGDQSDQSDMATPRVVNRHVNVKNQAGRLGTQSGPARGVTDERPKARIELTEGIAEVYRDGQFLGSTPVEIEGGENEAVNLSIRRAGYQELLETIEITTRRKVFTFTLKKNR